MIKGIHHAGIWVNDIQKILPFYTNFLGMKVVIDPDIMSGPLVDTLTGIPGAKVKAVIMEINGQAWEFLQLIEPPSKPFSPPYAQPGRGHICFEVTDIHEAYEKLKGKGGTLVCPPQEFPELKMFYFEDPESNRIEFVEMR